MRDFNPHSPDVERAVLGAGINDEQAAHLVAQLSADLFTNEIHRKILRSIKDCVSKGVQPDLLTVTNRLRELGEMAETENEGGSKVTAGHLLEAQEAGIIPSQVKAHVRILENLDRQRRLIRVAESTLHRATQRTLSPEELTELRDEIEQSIFDLETKDDNARGALQPASQVVRDTLELIERR